MENITVKPPSISLETRDKLVWEWIVGLSAREELFRKSKISLNLIFAVSFLTRRNPEVKPVARSCCSFGPELKSGA